VKLVALVLLACACRPESDFAPPDFSDQPLDFGEGADDADVTHFVTAQGGHLFADGHRFRFVGANRYDVASSPAYTCGNYYDDAKLDALLGELASTGATVLRCWAFQRFTAGANDFSSLDRVIATARAHNLKLIFTLENEWADCTGYDAASSDGRKSAAWYESGYFTTPLGSDALAYRDYARVLVERYRDEPQIAMWQLMNEAESSDGDALYAFALDMSQLVKTIDPSHLLSLGTTGTGQPGASTAQYRALHAIAGIDVVEAHDYNNEKTPMPSAIADDIATAMALGKPFFVGEAGIAAPAPMYPFSYAQRAALFDVKISAHWSAGSDGFLVWSFWDGRTDNWMGWDFNAQDPLAVILATHAAQMP
jgi:endo-1,4-beta-mannosidase